MNKHGSILTKSFCEKIVSNAIREAGPRYTPGCEKNAPNLNIKDLSFAFEILGRTQIFYEHFSALAEKFGEECNIDYSIKQIAGLHSQNQVDIGAAKTSEITRCLENLQVQLKIALETRGFNKDINFKAVSLISRNCLKAIGDVDSVLYQARDSKGPEDKNKSETINSLIYKFRTLSESISEIERFCDKPEIELANNPFLLLLGSAGIGKTHFLCDIASNRIAQNIPAIILLGNSFLKFDDPGKQIIKHLDIDSTFEKLVRKLNSQALKTNTRCLLIIDAVNEGDRKSWKKSINAFLNKLRPFKGIGFIVSCRTPFERVTLPKRPAPSFITLFHPGFRDIELDAQAAFFKYYKLPMPEVPILTPEFSNPLFLKLFCKAVEDTTVKKKHKQIKEISSGQKGMTYIFEFFVKARGKGIEQDFGLTHNYCWNQVFKYIAESMARNNREWISKKELRNLLAIKNKSRFIHRLISEGLFHETLEWEQGQKDPIEAIRFPYQKFSDHIIARYLLSNFLKTATDLDIKNSLADVKGLGSLFGNDNAVYNRAGIIEALLIEFPARIKNKGELFDFLDPKIIRIPLVEVFVGGLIWRDSAAINKSTGSWVQRILCNSQLRNKMLEVLVVLGTKPKHPYNASRLDKFLKPLEMVKRDLVWTEFLRKLDSHNSVYRLLSWIEIGRGQNITPDYAQMCFLINMWVLTSTNHLLRDRATRALYYIGCKFPEMLFNFTVESLQINDPYVPERMLAASYGVAMALQHEKGFAEKTLKNFANQIYVAMFKTGALYSTTHILARDYARQTINLSLLHNEDLLTKPEKQRTCPPFQDGGIRSWGNAEDKNKGEYRDGNSPFGFNFDNYTLGYLLPKRNNYDFNNPDYIKLKGNMWWRIYQLGYSLDKFENIDKEIHQQHHYRSVSGETSNKIDRYGKKYCWIAWYEIAGFRQDNGLLKREWDSERDKRLKVDIDPSFPENIPFLEIIKKDYLGKRVGALPNWIASGPAPDISPYLMLNAIQGEPGPWVLLDGYVQQANLELKKDVFIFPRGILVEKEDSAEIVKFLKKQHLGGRWLPEIMEQRSAFAGEMPWSEMISDNGAVELSFIVGTKEKQVAFKETECLKDGRALTTDELKELSSIVANFQSKELQEKQFADYISQNKIQIRQVAKVRTEIINEARKFNVSLPITMLTWNAEESGLQGGENAYVLSKEISEYLGLTSRPQTFDLYDKTNRKASIIVQLGDNLHKHQKLIYMRKDLLDKLLKDKGLDFVWGVWGERTYKAKNNAGLDDFVKKHKAYKDFQKVIAYKDILSGSRKM